MQNKYATNDFLNRLYNGALPKENLLNCEDSDFSILMAKKKRQTAKILKLAELQAALEEELAYKISDTFETDGVKITKYDVTGINSLVMPVYVLDACSEVKDTVLYIHGHDKFGVQGALKHLEAKSYHKWLALEMAKAGYRVIAPEMAGFGEAVKENHPYGSADAGLCFANSAALLMSGFNMAGLRVYQIMRTLDFAQKLGINSCIAFGVSGGGLVCQFAGVLDIRIRAMIVAAYPNTYEDSTLARDHCIDNYVPGMLSVGESYEVLSLAVPKPLLAINGTRDPIFPRRGSEKAFSYIKDVYLRYGEGNNFTGKLFSGVHEISDSDVMEWLDKNSGSKNKN